MIGFGFTISLNDAFSNVAGKIKSSFAGLQGMSDKAMKTVDRNAVRMETGMKMMAGGAAILAPLGMAVKTSMEFNKAISGVGAVANASEEELKKLKDQAMLLGETTAFTAKEVAEGQKFLAMAGFGVNDTLAAMPGMLSLASAGQLQLGQAADIASNVLSMFQMNASEANRVSDVLAKTANRSNTSVTQFAEAMKYIGGSAASLGVPLEEVSALIGILGDNGLQGSMSVRVIGTALQGFAKPTKEMKKVMEELNIDMFDSQGKFKGLAGMIEEVEKATTGMTDKQKLATISTLFGKDAADNILLTMNAQKKIMTENGEVTLRGAQALRGFTKELQNSSGAADKMASMQLDNLAGSLTIMNSGIEGLMINMGDKLEPVLKKAVDIFNVMLGKINSLIKSPIGDFLIPLVAGLGGILVVGGALITTIGAMNIAWATALPVIKAAGAAISSAIGGPLLPIIVGIGALVGAVIFLKKSWESFSGVMKTGEVASGGFMRVMQQIGGIMQGIGALFDTASARGFAFSEEMNNAFEQLGILGFMTALGTYASRLAAMWDGFKYGYEKSIAPAFSKIGSAASNLFSAFQPLITIGERIFNLFLGGFEKATSSTLDWADAGEQLARIVGGAFSFVGGVISGIAQWIGFVINQISLYANIVIDTFMTIKGLFKNYQEGWISFGELFTGIGSAIVDAIWNGITGSWENFKSLFIGLVSELPFGDKILEFAGVSKGGGNTLTPSVPAGTGTIAAAPDATTAKINKIKENAVAQNTVGKKAGTPPPSNITVQPPPVTMYVQIEKETIAKATNEYNEINGNRL